MAKRLVLLLALIADLVLLVNLCRPVAAPLMYEQEAKEKITVVEQEQKELEAHQDLKEAMAEYNLQLAQDQSGLDSVDSYEEPGLNLEDYGLEEDDVVGYVEIPAMEVAIPLYLGASKSNMNNGAVVLGQTSMPIGGSSTNCVIAAHRGWNNMALFRDIEVLQEGDLVYLVNLWETLTYRVIKTSIIWPDEVEAVTIQPGQDMVTLLTCHPYTANTYRYLVYCQRVAEPEQQGIVPGQTQNTSARTTETKIKAEQEQGLQILSVAMCGGAGICLMVGLLRRGQIAK